MRCELVFIRVGVLPLNWSIIMLLLFLCLVKYKCNTAQYGMV